MAEVIQIVVPPGAFGQSPYDDSLDSAMRLIADNASPNSGEEWAEKYGTEFENEVFAMHPFCWCEKDDCPWCAGCNCTEHYWVDGKEVTFDEWMEFYYQETYGKLGLDRSPHTHHSHDEYVKLSALGEEVNKRRPTTIDGTCDRCVGERFKDKGAIPGKPAPNFWHKPTGLRVWWYKYIGRDMETNMPVTEELIERVRVSCIRSIP